MELGNLVPTTPSHQANRDSRLIDELDALRSGDAQQLCDDAHFMAGDSNDHLHGGEGSGIYPVNCMHESEQYCKTSRPDLGPSHNHRIAKPTRFALSVCSTAQPTYAH